MFLANSYILHADTLSRTPVSPSESSNLQAEADLFLALSVDHLPASSQRINTIRKAQDSDPVCFTLVSYFNKGWPYKSNLSVPLMPYWKFRGQLSVHNNLMLYGSHIVIPYPMQQEMLKKLHEGHQGIQRCLLHAQISIW